MTILVKNMVCRHCIDKVKAIAGSIDGLNVRSVDLGRIEVSAEPSAEAMELLSRQLHEAGFEIIKSREAETVERIKLLLIELSRGENSGRVNLSTTLSDALATPYKTLSRTFAETEGRTIENYFIALRLERVKELLHYGRMTLDEIAFETGFSSSAHLSRQFKQLTGMTPTQFRELGHRKPLQDV